MALSTLLLGRLLAAAVQFSGLPAIDVSDLPPIDVIDTGAFLKAVCPQKPARCVPMMAAFDTQHYRIVIRDSLNMDDPSHNSFLVHEMVHVLQYKRDGSTRFMSCEAVIESERQAFNAQNLYMESNGLLQREGSMLRYMKCPPPNRPVGDNSPPS
ncbi:hypothetical protein [Noviherbaspirillum sp. Root189]|uniref:hypothetical protein n=1 Tax=Noviherbaspirillum sp. Root189 TaxID=1736487 RepID=UPI00070D57A5|nr:hypothetical protein [Noviherbaspirillum sp. Root189]KRB70564.1 hypothetical protein ASE07_08145 [Noviherbaspirillum sp. Root189]